MRFVIAKVGTCVFRPPFPFGLGGRLVEDEDFPRACEQRLPRHAVDVSRAPHVCVCVYVCEETCVTSPVEARNKLLRLFPTGWAAFYPTPNFY